MTTIQTEAQLVKKLMMFAQAMAEGAASAKVILDKHREKVESDPIYAFEWADKAFEAAAEYHVYSKISHHLEKCTIEELKRSVMEEIMNRAQYPTQSTSSCSNLIDQYKLKAYAKVMERLKWLEA